MGMYIFDRDCLIRGWGSSALLAFRLNMSMSEVHDTKVHSLKPLETFLAPITPIS